MKYKTEDFECPELPWTSGIKPRKAAEIANVKLEKILEPIQIENQRLWGFIDDLGWVPPSLADLILKRRNKKD